MRLWRFLNGGLLPHARGDERHLYPLIDALVRLHEKPTATMMVDHKFITDYATRITNLTHELEGGPRTNDANY